MSVIRPVTAPRLPPNYELLASLKRSRDPDNLFRANKNIAPARDQPAATLG
jgi:hypothetical protein